MSHYLLWAIPDPEHEGSSMILFTFAQDPWSTLISKKFCNFESTIFPAPSESILFDSSLYRFGSASHANTFPLVPTNSASWWVLLPGAAQQSRTTSPASGWSTNGGKHDALSCRTSLLAFVKASSDKLTEVWNANNPDKQLSISTSVFSNENDAVINSYDSFKSIHATCCICTCK